MIVSFSLLMASVLAQPKPLEETLAAFELAFEQEGYELYRTNWGVGSTKQAVELTTDVEQGYETILFVAAMGCDNCPLKAAVVVGGQPVDLPLKTEAMDRESGPPVTIGMETIAIGEKAFNDITMQFWVDLDPEDYDDYNLVYALFRKKV